MRKGTHAVDVGTQIGQGAGPPMSSREKTEFSSLTEGDRFLCIFERPGKSFRYSPQPMKEIIILGACIKPLFPCQL
jgi:hypothetical protein